MARATSVFNEVKDVDEEVVNTIKAGILELQFVNDIVTVRKRVLFSRLAVTGIAFTWIIFVYFIYVYGVKMYKKVGPGSEKDYIVSWVTFLLVDNLVLGWRRAFKSAFVHQVAVTFVSIFSHLLDPLKWFEGFDDNSALELLDAEDIDIDEMDDMEAGDLDILGVF
mmetsp:Transcript_38215/g.120698  ORF Transcript_38215/g.120698 Transcript_38215/m.120698 type:complete len:166 (-) Transcript_38215:555-1052(-)